MLVVNAVIEVRLGGYEDWPDKVLDNVSNVCHTRHVKPPKENDGSQEGTNGMKRPLPDSAEDAIVAKKAA